MSSFHHAGPSDQIQLGLEARPFYMMSHLTSPVKSDAGSHACVLLPVSITIKDSYRVSNSWTFYSLVSVLCWCLGFCVGWGVNFIKKEIFHLPQHRPS